VALFREFAHRRVRPECHHQVVFWAKLVAQIRMLLAQRGSYERRPELAAPYAMNVESALR
jgi:hypothetical protein